MGEAKVRMSLAKEALNVSPLATACMTCDDHDPCMTNRWGFFFQPGAMPKFHFILCAIFHMWFHLFLVN